jgi:hypothetical protein
MRRSLQGRFDWLADLVRVWRKAIAMTSDTLCLAWARYQETG